MEAFKQTAEFEAVKLSGLEGSSGTLPPQAIREFLEDRLAGLGLSRSDRLLVIIPDRTRTAPLPLLFREIYRNLVDRIARVDFLVALGTHPLLEESELRSLVGVTEGEWESEFPRTEIFNHDWRRQKNFVTVGTLSSEEVSDVVQPVLKKLPHPAGLIRDIEVSLNRKIEEYDHLLICGPTFPHEVVGFSGGNKYFFPGIAGPEIIHYTHWLGALIGTRRVIGRKDTPIREIIDRAAALIDRPRSCLSLVVAGDGLAGLFLGTPEDAFSAAARLSEKIHIRWLDRPVKRVLSVMPQMYDDLWTAAKGMYKLEPVVSEGGEIILYAPHISEVSYTHGELLERIGYHVRDYFLARWDDFKNFPGGILAHSIHLRGDGSYDADTGVERARIGVTLASQISPERCRRIGLGYRDPTTVDIPSWEEQGDDYLLVPKAGEKLFRLNKESNRKSHSS